MIFFAAGTYTVEALNFARTNAFIGDFGDRPGIPNYVIFITDGVSIDNIPPGSLKTAADKLHEVAQAVHSGCYL